MGDIDFDELDKAVSSLMSSSDAPAAPKKATNRHQRQAPKAAAVHRRHSSAASRVSAKKPTSESKTPKVPAKAMDMRFTPSKTTTPAPATRRSGRFMDVVDSSSEPNPIRKPITITPPSREVLRKPEPEQILTEQEEMPTISPVVVTQSTIPEPTPVLTPIEPVIQPSIPAFSEQFESATEAVPVRLVAKSAPVPDPLELLHADAPVSTVEIADSKMSEDDVRPAAVFGTTSLETTAPSRSESVTVTVKPSAPIASQSPAPTFVSAPVMNQPQEDPRPTTATNESAELEKLKHTIDALASNLTANEEAPSTTTEPITLPNEVETPENESPFLSDTKIEKRPLNAYPTEVTKPTEPTSWRSVEANDTPKEPESFEEPLQIMPHEQPEVSEVPELATELVALEATGKSEYELDEPPVPIKSSTDGSQKNNHPKKEQVTGPTSISQQYQSKESTGDASHAPIYDASEYAEPVAHPAKKKSGWIWVLVIFIILALASGGAVALYLTGIIP